MGESELLRIHLLYGFGTMRELNRADIACHFWVDNVNLNRIGADWSALILDKNQMQTYSSQGRYLDKM